MYKYVCLLACLYQLLFPQVNSDTKKLFREDLSLFMNMWVLHEQSMHIYRVQENQDLSASVLLIGHSSLSWITRVQIALDAARGLEYIHEYTKTRYVHQDINTSNILLDASFRAKVITNLDNSKLFLNVFTDWLIAIILSIDIRFWVSKTC